MKRHSGKLVLSLFIGALLLWLSLRNVEFSKLGETFASVDLLLVLAAFLVGQVSTVIRAWRWRILLLRPVGTARLFSAIMIGYFANNALPARLGELLRLESVQRSDGVPRGEGLTSIVVEKVFDGLTLCFVLGGLLLFNDFPPWVSWIGASSLAVFGGASLFALLSLHYRDFLLRITGRILTPLGRPGTLLLAFATSAAAGLETLRRPTNLLKCLLLSFGIWCAEMISVSLLFRAAGLSLSPWAALFVITMLSLGMLVPSPPGFLGTYEYVGSRALAVFGVEPSTALAVIFLLHLQFLFATTAVGLLCVVVSGQLPGLWKRARKASQAGGEHVA